MKRPHNLYAVVRDYWLDGEPTLDEFRGIFFDFEEAEEWRETLRRGTGDRYNIYRWDFDDKEWIIEDE